jgi:hypothetical protein
MLIKNSLRLVIAFSCVVIGQIGNAQSLKLDWAEQVGVIRSLNSDIILSTSPIHPDGPRSLMRLNKDLKKIWRLDLSLGNLGSIRDFQIVGKRILILAEKGQLTGNSVSGTLNFVVAGLDGKITRNTVLGPSFGTPSNILIHGTKAYVSYPLGSFPNGRARIADTTVFASLDLVTGKIEKIYYRGNLNNGRLIRFGTSFVSIGEQDRSKAGKERDLSVLMVKDKKMSRKIFVTEGYDNIYGAFSENGTLSMLSQYNRLQNKDTLVFLLKFTLLDSLFNILFDSVISYQDLGFHSLVQKAFTENNRYYIFSQKDPKVGKYHLLEFSAQGKLLGEKEYAIDHPSYMINYFKVGGNSYITTRDSYTSPIVLHKLPMRP